MKYTIDKLEETYNQFNRILFNEKDGEIAKQFLLDRKLGNLDDLSKYEFGYCPIEFPYPSSQSLYVDNRLWWLRGRLIVTIRDHHNRIISFAGRKIDSNKEKLHSYLLENINSPILSYLDGDTNKIDKMVEDWDNRKWINEIYPKKEYLFGLNKAKKYIFDMGYAVIVEGYMDAISMWLNGFPNTVALCGVAMSDIHLSLLKRYTNHLVYCLDSDEAGNRGVNKIIDLINDKYNLYFSYYIVYLSKGLDPEDMLKKDKKIFINSIIESSKRKDIKLKKKFLDLSDNLTRQILKSK